MLVIVESVFLHGWNWHNKKFCKKSVYRGMQRYLDPVTETQLHPLIYIQSITFQHCKIKQLSETQWLGLKVCSTPGFWFLSANKYPSWGEEVSVKLFSAQSKKEEKKICFYYKWLTTRQVFMPKCQHALPWTSRLTCQGPQATLKWGKESNSAEDSIHWLKLNIFYRTSQRRLKPPSQKASSCLYKVCCKIIQFNSTHRTDVYIQNQKMFFSSKA